MNRGPIIPLYSGERGGSYSRVLRFIIEIAKPSLSLHDSFVYTFLHFILSLFVTYIVSFLLFVWLRRLALLQVSLDSSFFLNYSMVDTRYELKSPQEKDILKP